VFRNFLISPLYNWWYVPIAAPSVRRRALLLLLPAEFLIKSHNTGEIIDNLIEGESGDISAASQQIKTAFIAGLVVFATVCIDLSSVILILMDVLGIYFWSHLWRTFISRYTNSTSTCAQANHKRTHILLCTAITLGFVLRGVFPWILLPYYFL
jgi:hypothetical protein